MADVWSERLARRESELCATLDRHSDRLAPEIRWPAIEAPTVLAVARQCARAGAASAADVADISAIDRLQSCLELIGHIRRLLGGLDRLEPTSQQGRDLQRWLTSRLVDLGAAADPERSEVHVATYRRLAKVNATLLTLESWQSPQGSHPLHDVYHRQKTPFTGAMAARFAGYEPPARSHRARAHLFSSYMAGFNTVLWYLWQDSDEGLWLVDDRVYVECRQVFEALPKVERARIRRVDAHDPIAFDHSIATLRPRAIILDAAPNLPELPLLDLDHVFATLARHPTDQTRTIVVDHSLIGTLFDARGQLERHPRETDVFVFARSLQKMDFGGLDLCSGGYFKVVGHAETDLGFELWDHLRGLSSLLGTGLVEHSAAVLHPPDAALHREWHGRSLRNGWLLCQSLRSALLPTGLAGAVNHPSMPEHTAHARLMAGSVVAPPMVFVELDEAFALSYFDRQPILAASALESDPELPIGASFGFHRTRASWWVDPPRLALRVAVGVEPVDAIPGVAAAVISLLTRLRELLLSTT